MKGWDGKEDNRRVLDRGKRTLNTKLHFLPNLGISSDQRSINAVYKINIIIFKS